MSGIVSGIDYSVLFSGSTFASGNSDASALLASLNSSGSGIVGSDPIAAFTAAQKNETKSVAAEAKTPSVARDIAVFKQAVASAKTIQDALKNPDILKVLLTANDLGDQTGYTSLAQKALLSDPNDPKSLASQLQVSNGKWLATVKTYNFAKNGLAELQNPKVQTALANAYAEISWQKSLDKTTPGLANALQFIKQAGSITSVDQILGDSVNREVVLTALGIPKQLAFQSLDAQEREVAKHLDLKRLQDPKFVTGLTDQYLLNNQQSSTATTTSLASLAVQASSLVV
jgi:hypothetical protein